jgi:preprotein translocase subunit SecE
MEALKIGGSWVGTFWVVFSVLLAAFVWVKSGKSIQKFISEVSAELKKCSWPWDEKKSGFAKYRELFDSTVVVVVSTILLSAIVTFSDFILLKVIGLVTRLH